ncbi:ASCH domain-containing protein [Chloroflexota bacterium]
MLIRSPWIDLILKGQKTWELRGRRTSVRGTIVLIRAGSGQISGSCQLVGVTGPLGLADIKMNVDKHRIPPEDISRFSYGKIFAWELSNANTFRSPIPYKHPRGAVVWVRLPDLILRQNHA